MPFLMRIFNSSLETGLIAFHFFLLNLPQRACISFVRVKCSMKYHLMGQVDELHVYHKIMSLICYFYTNLLYFCTKKEPVTITDSNCIFFIKLRCMPTIINFFRSKETFYTIWITNTDLNMRLFSKSRGLIDRIAF